MKRCTAVLAALLAAVMLLSACGKETPAVTTEAPATEAPEVTTEEITVGKPDDGFNHIDGKTVLFLGNSFVYYGGLVENRGQFDGPDKGIFYRVCQSFGDEVTVIDRTFGAHSMNDFTEKGCKCSSKHERENKPYNGCPGMKTDLLKDIDLDKVDYVFISEAGQDNAYLLRSFTDISSRFPNKDTKFFYLSHSYTYTAGATGLINSFPAMKEAGIGIVEWGKLVFDVMNGKTAVEGAAMTYSKDSFIVNKLDTHHPNPLSGYIASLMCYCAITGRSAVGADYSFMKDARAGNGSDDGKLALALTEFVDMYYNPGTTNYPEVFASAADMAGLQKLMDEYLGDLIIQK